MKSLATAAITALSTAVFFVGWLFLGFNGEGTARSAPSTARAAGAADRPVLNTWFALGSGCRARSDASGDVSMEPLPIDPTQPNVYRVRFHLNDFRAASDEVRPGASEKASANFARECAVRLNVNPPEGQRLVRVRAATEVVADKGPGAKLTVRGELKLGNTTLGVASAIHDQGIALFHHDEPITLVPGDGGEPLPKLACGEPKILGFDYTFLVERPSSSDAAHVTLAGPKTLELEAELAPCTP
jgi:hypothetical protein